MNPLTPLMCIGCFVLAPLLTIETMEGPARYVAVTMQVLVGFLAIYAECNERRMLRDD